MTYIRGEVWIFGGYSPGKHHNDIFKLNFDQWKWEELILPKSAYIPSPRQGHSAVLHGNYLFIIGGCNHQVVECYNDTNRFDL